MPDTTGTKPNFAAFRGQTLTLRKADQKPYSQDPLLRHDRRRLGGGDFTLRFADDTHADRQRRSSPTGAARRRTRRPRTSRSAAYPALPRQRRQRQRAVRDLPRPADVTPDQDAGLGDAAAARPTPAAPTTAYLMALTLEEPAALRDAGPHGAGPVPERRLRAGDHATLDPARARRRRLVRGPVRVDADGAGRARAAPASTRSSYRVNGGKPQVYTGPFTFSTEGAHTLEYRAIDGAGNTEAFKAVPLQDRPARAAHDAARPGRAAGADGWYDGAVDGALRRRRRRRLGRRASTRVPLRRRRLAAVRRRRSTRRRRALHELAVPLDATSRATRRPTQTLRAQGRRRRAPATALPINGAAPKRATTGRRPRRAHRARRRGGGRRPRSEYRVDGGEWTAYTGAVRRRRQRRPPRSTTAPGTWLGNVENYKHGDRSRISPAPLTVPAPLPIAGRRDAAREPFAALEPVAAGRRRARRCAATASPSAISCQSVERGTVSLTVSRAVASGSA